MKKTIRLLALSALSISAGGLSETHDGFMFRYTLGLSNLSNTLTDGTNELNMNGMGASNSLIFGGSLNPNLVLGFELNATKVEGPTFESGGKSQTIKNSTLTNFNFGPAISYYFPNNIYAGLGLGAAQFQSSNSDLDVKGASDIGFGVTVNAGKEWWVSENWGLGLNANIQYMSADDSKDCDNCTMSGTSVGVAFSATFN